MKQSCCFNMAHQRTHLFPSSRGSRLKCMGKPYFSTITNDWNTQSMQTDSEGVDDASEVRAWEVSMDVLIELWNLVQQWNPLFPTTTAAFHAVRAVAKVAPQATSENVGFGYALSKKKKLKKVGCYINGLCSGSYKKHRRSITFRSCCVAIHIFLLLRCLTEEKKNSCKMQVNIIYWQRGGRVYLCNLHVSLSFFLSLSPSLSPGCLAYPGASTIRLYCQCQQPVLMKEPVTNRFWAAFQV